MEFIFFRIMWHNNQDKSLIQNTPHQVENIFASADEFTQNIPLRKQLDRRYNTE